MPDPFRPEDRFVRGFVRTAVHVRRFLPFYVAGLAWLAMMVVVRPVGGGGSGVDSGSVAAPAVGRSSPSAVPAADVSEVAPGVGAPELLVGEVGDVGAVAVDLQPAPAPTPSEPPSARDTFIVEPAPPRPLTITRSGYSSRTGGTALEQPPPANGLPVAASAGQATKRSFIGVTGDAKVLRLKLVDDPSAGVGADAAHVLACTITQTGWKAERGASFDHEPAWGVPCVAGERQADGSWAWDLSLLGDVRSLLGLALAPDPASAAATFNLVFAPVAVATSP